MTLFGIGELYIKLPRVKKKIIKISQLKKILEEKSYFCQVEKI